MVGLYTREFLNARCYFGIVLLYTFTPVQYAKGYYMR